MFVPWAHTEQSLCPFLSTWLSLYSPSRLASASFLSCASTLWLIDEIFKHESESIHSGVHVAIFCNSLLHEGAHRIGMQSKSWILLHTIQQCTAASAFWILCAIDWSKALAVAKICVWNMPLLGISCQKLGSMCQCCAQRRLSYVSLRQIQYQSSIKWQKQHNHLHSKQLLYNGQSFVPLVHLDVQVSRCPTIRYPFQFACNFWVTCKAGTSSNLMWFSGFAKHALTRYLGTKAWCSYSSPMCTKSSLTRTSWSSWSCAVERWIEASDGTNTEYCSVYTHTKSQTEHNTCNMPFHNCISTTISNTDCLQQSY